MKKFNWGHGILFAIIGMVVFVVVLVAVATRQNFDLVEKDYYQRGVHFDDHLKKIENVGLLAEKIGFSEQDGVFVFSFPQTGTDSVLSGTIHFYNPAGESSDHIWKIEPGKELLQRIPKKQFARGKYTIKIDWQLGEKAFYQEFSTIIN